MIDRKSVLVIGAWGFLGNHVCQYFSNQGYRIIKVGRRNNSSEFDKPNEYTMELPNSLFIELLRAHQPDLIVHCGGTASVQKSFEDTEADFMGNVSVCASILEAVRRQLIHSKIVLISSASVYGNPQATPVKEISRCSPISPYGYHKLMCEILAQEYANIHGLDIAILRIFSAYGPGLKQQVIYDLFRKFTNPDSDVVEVYGTGHESRDFIHCTDIARAIEHVWIAPISGILNLASGQETTISKVVSMVKDKLGSQKPVIYTGHIRHGDPLRWQADISRLHNSGFSNLTSLDEGIGNFKEWFLTSK